MHFSLSRRRYIEEQIQREGVAMETSGFTFVTSGKKKKTLTGPATMVAFPHFRPLSDNAAVMSVLIASARSLPAAAWWLTLPPPPAHLGCLVPICFGPAVTTCETIKPGGKRC